MNYSLVFQVREPRTKQDKNPLLLLLHGYGSNDADLFSFAPNLPGEYYVIAARAPHSLYIESFAWYAINFTADETKFSDLDQARESRELIVKFIDEISANLPIDPHNITLIGFSQGAILSYAVALSYPEKVHRVVAMSGYINLEIAKDDFRNNDLKNIDVFASHGIVDQVIPVEWARKTPIILDGLGIKNVYKEYNCGHGVAPQNFYDVVDWLSKHK